MDRYGSDVLAAGRPAPGHARRTSTELAATPGVVVEDVETGFCGAVLRVERSGGLEVVVLEDRRGRPRAFPLGPGFLVDGEPVVLVRPAAKPAPAAPTRTASGSRAVAGHTARVARGSRIWVEGTHDAELVEKIWGHDLRVEGVVVEPLDGVDNLAAAVRQFQPGASRRLGVLVDHLVAGSKEARIAADTVRGLPGSEYVLIVGHPFVDVWQSVKPGRVGLRRWPVIARGTSWKHGVLEHLGLPHRDQADVARGWQAILATVRTYEDLEPSFLGRVEELIDFVTAVPDTP